jgi:hypothetical protein
MPANHNSRIIWRRSIFQTLKTLGLYARRTLTIELFLHLFLDDVPAFFCMRHNAGGAVLHARGKSRIVARAVEEKEWTVAEKA